MQRPTACVIAHPAHELRVFHWLETTQPSVFVITDGSGGSGASRLHMTRDVLDTTGARPGSVFGAMTDREAYALIMTRDSDGLRRVFGSLIEGLQAISPSVIVGDACEGYNPVHDLCRVLIDAACSVLGIDDPERNLGFRLTGVPKKTPGCLSIDLDDDALARKLASARAYTAVDGEVREALAQGGIGPFRCEVLEPQRGGPAYEGEPYYETFGRERVRLGIYRESLTLDHLRAATDVIRDFAATHG